MWQRSTVWAHVTYWLAVNQFTVVEGEHERRPAPSWEGSCLESPADRDPTGPVAGHIAHAADSVEWFVDGAFGEGWNMDFEGLIAAARAVETLAEAVAWLDRTFDQAIATFKAASDEDLAAPIPDKGIMPGASRTAILVPIVDHTAHHRGALTVYARLLGKVPKMMYD